MSGRSGAKHELWWLVTSGATTTVTRGKVPMFRFLRTLFQPGFL